MDADTHSSPHTCTAPPERGQLPFPFPEPCVPGAGLRVAGLFAGIGGLELGLGQAGHRGVVLCEVDEPAARVLRARFAETPLVGDIRAVKALPRVDLVAAGFPCQDLSQAGRTAGIGGTRSGLVREVFRLLGKARPRWWRRNAAKAQFLLDYAEITALVKAEFPRDKPMQGLFFDEVHKPSSGAEADEGGDDSTDPEPPPSTTTPASDMASSAE